MMIYISKGIVQNGSTENILTVERGGKCFNLTGAQAKLWLDGRYEFNYANKPDLLRELHNLAQMGLVEYEMDSDALAKYRILTRCVCCAAVTPFLTSRVFRLDRVVLDWIRNAGLRLSLTELIYLQENGIAPDPSLLGVDNRQALVETIYTRCNIADNLLESQMEKAACRDDIVQSILSLLRKRKIVIL